MKSAVKYTSLMTAMATFLVAGTASAQFYNLVPTGTTNIGGTGLGSVSTILTIQSPGSSDTEQGCVSALGIGPNAQCVDQAGAAFLDARTLTGNSQTKLVSVSELAGLTGSNLAVVLNFSENQNEPDGLLDRLVLTLYGPTGTDVLFRAALANDVYFANTFAGTGNSGFSFQLDAAGAAAFDAALVAGARIGLGAELDLVTGGNETFFIATLDQGSPVAVPEPASIVLLGTGLLGVVGFARHRRRTTA